MFHAEELAVIQDGVLVAGLRGSTASGKEHYLMLQLADTFDGQDLALEQATYFVELGGQTAGGYGGIVEVEVRAGCLHVRLSDKGSTNLGAPTRFCISLDASLDSGDVAEAVERIVGGHGVPVRCVP